MEGFTVPDNKARGSVGVERGNDSGEGSEGLCFQQSCSLTMCPGICLSYHSW